jgi:hypothetical protein
MIPRKAPQILKELLAQEKPVMILGARQVGKTTLVQSTLSESDSAYLNLDIATDKARLISLAALAPREAIAALAGNKPYLVIDEAQRWDGLGQVVKGWYDARVSCKIVLLGSSSLDLLDKSSEALTGRNEKLYLPTLLLLEVIEDQPWYTPSLTKAQVHQNFASQLKALHSQYLVFGLYPEAVTTLRKVPYLLNLAHDYVLKDVFQLGLTRTPETLRTLLQLLAHQIGSEVSINELATRLGATRPTVERYLQLLQDTFVIFKLPAFSRNPRNEISKSAKYYFWDVGVRNAIINNFAPVENRTDVGALWENLIVAEFAKHNALTGYASNVYFWRNKDQSEVDLVVEKNGVLSAFEIKWSSVQRVGSVGRAFTASYATPVTILHPGNVLEQLPELPLQHQKQ